MEQAWISTFCWYICLISYTINPFQGTGLFLYFLKYIRKPKPKLCWCFQGTLKDNSAIKWVENNLTSSYLFVTYLSNWRQFIQLKSFLQSEFINFPHLILMANLSPITLIKLFLFFLTLLVVFFFQFEACKTYCFPE